MKDGGGPAQAAFSDRIARWERDISASADRIADHLRRKRYVVLFLFSAVYLLATCFRASRKLFWFDELVTVRLSRLSDMVSVWNALKQGADLNPPVFYGLTRFSEFLFGEGHIAARLPEILGCLVFCLCLFRFVSSRTSVLAGLISMLFPLVTTAYFYAYEARPHGIVLGCAGLALVCWQAAIRSRRRKGWWAVGLFAALLCAVLNHAYAILLFIPFGLAELVRAVSLRRVDRSIWLAIASASLGVLSYLPLYLRAKTGLAATFFQPTVSMMANTYHAHLSPAVGILSVALILTFVFQFGPPDPQAPKNEGPSLEMPEVVVLIAFVALPLFSYLVAKLAGAPLFHRYSISTVAGFACLLGIVAAKRPPVALGVLLLLAAQIEFDLFQYAQSATLTEPSTSIGLCTRASAFRHQYSVMEAVPGQDLPIVLMDDLEFLPIMHYAPANIASRLVYVVGPYSDANGEGYIVLQRLCPAPGHFVRVSEFLSTHDTFLALCNSKSLYKMRYFIDKGGDVRMESPSLSGVLYTVTFRKNQGAGEGLSIRPAPTPARTFPAFAAPRLLFEARSCDTRTPSRSGTSGPPRRIQRGRAVSNR